ncbi:exosortase C-terminal domain/associated protein EpsI [Aquabacterium sp.]|uniref:exosortase C-terminal domain/associated protein EpsI n=1 Tax=Aquabacterium sp. TaxID=1872578 RepID=UPI0025BF93FA|nr:exosortase C-terminal domain/associated protein EpsI [Aquabacterium sp.]
MARKLDAARPAWTMAVWCAAALMLVALGASEWLKPRRILADTLPPMTLEEVIPRQFGDWVEVQSQVPVVSDPSIEAAVKALYSSTLVRTYRDAAGHVIFLSVAYGKNQNSWSTAAHRPEFCYAAQGFEVAQQGVAPVSLSQSPTLQTIRLMATLNGRIEPISYWVTLADTPTLPGVGRKFQQFRYGLQGWIVDGLLVRISSLGGGDGAYDAHAKFMRDLDAAMQPGFRARFFGRT